MAPPPLRPAATTPLSSPPKKLRGEYCPTAEMPSAQADLPDPPGRLKGLLAPNPDFEFPGATKPSSLSREIFKRLAQPAAVSAAELKVVEGTSLQIVDAILKGRRVTDGWAVTHLVRHVDILWGGQFLALDALADGLVKETARRGCQNPWLGPSSYAEYPTYSACVRAHVWMREE